MESASDTASKFLEAHSDVAGTGVSGKRDPSITFSQNTMRAKGLEGASEVLESASDAPGEVLKAPVDQVYTMLTPSRYLH